MLFFSFHSTKLKSTVDSAIAQALKANKTSTLRKIMPISEQKLSDIIRTETLVFFMDWNMEYFYDKLFPCIAGSVMRSTNFKWPEQNTDEI